MSNNDAFSVQLTISFNPNTGQVMLGGPIQNTMFCLGLLEMAKVSLLEFRAKSIEQKGPTIIPVPANGLPHLKP